LQATEENWREVAEKNSKARGYGLAGSESPYFVGRAVAALAADPDRARWNQRSVNGAELAAEYGFTDVDGTQPNAWSVF
jgi:hypothetical protein